LIEGIDLWVIEVLTVSVTSTDSRHFLLKCHLELLEGLKAAISRIPSVSVVHWVATVVVVVSYDWLCCMALHLPTLEVQFLDVHSILV